MSSATAGPSPARPTSLCRGCHRRFVAAPKRGRVPEERRQLVRRLLRERLGLRAITRVAGVSRPWLQGFVNALYRDETHWEPEPEPEPPQKSRHR